jgi:hypothetical protein
MALILSIVSMYVRRVREGKSYPFNTDGLRLTVQLVTRGWVFKERLLSPSTFHFSKDEMDWE